MGLYDIMDEIAAKQVTKSETGDNRMLGVVVGVIAKNYDQNMPGRVCVQVPVRDDEANELQWARVAMPSSGKKWGHYFQPEEGDQVLLAFEHGNIEKPYVIGCVPKENNTFLTKSVHEKNQYKKIVTRHGSTIQFDDCDDEDGKKDKISIYTAGGSHRLILDNEKNEITLGNKNGKNELIIKTEEEQGSVEIKTEKKLTITVGDNIKLIMNADSGTVSVKCSKFTVDASDGSQIKTSGKLGLSGGNVSIEASSMLKAESSGMTSVGGSPVKIG
ncbi:MAG: hypothetical protein J6C33_00340 [Lachnospiraceae bacterium]|nr:hypothetical protein [Lachnospiraceae bacterium]